MRLILALMAVLLIVPGLALCSSVRADVGASAGPSREKTLSPYFWIQNGDENLDELPLKDTRAEVNITGVIADVTVTQAYQNTGTRPIHAKYVFPASTRAAVHGMTLTVGERVIRAEIKEREEAKQTFDTAKKAGKSAALLEQQRPNVFSMDVANILPGDLIKVELHYSELIVPTEGTYEFVYPTVVGPRYSEKPESGAARRDNWIQSPYLQEKEAPTYTFDLKARVSTGLPLQALKCESHQAQIDWLNPATAEVWLDEGQAGSGNKDFILRYRLEGQKVQTGMMLYPGKDENFFLMMMQPPKRVKTVDIPPREYIFVVDVSGSMSGFPLNTAKDLLRDLIGNLRPEDSFNVILFAGASKLMAPASLPANQTNIDEAIRFLNRQRGGGGTRLYQALHRAYNLPGAEGRSRSMIMVTDGYIGAEREVFDLIREELNTANLFAFGIGSSVNRYLIEGMAKSGQGEPFVVTSPSEASETADRFRDYISSPVLTDIQVAFDGFETYDLEPPQMPDLFADRPLVLFGKWRGPVQGEVKVTGVSGQGAFSQSLPIRDLDNNASNRALRYLWARTRLARISDFDGDRRDADRKAEIVTLGLTYNLLTDHTSFVAVHDVVRNTTGDGKDVKQPLPLPEGVSNLAVGNAHSVPEPELTLLILVALALTGLTPGFRRALVVWIRRVPKK